MSLGQKITKVRKEKKLSQVDVASFVGVSRDAISKYERDDIIPSVENAHKIAKVLEVSLDYLTGLSDLELDKNIVDVVTSLQKLNNEDREQIFTAINALIRDAKTRNTCA
jgi:transcriptional regulator with XRE-family HTH domain